jgi:hypothetical protein
MKIWMLRQMFRRFLQHQILSKSVQWFSTYFYGYGQTDSLKELNRRSTRLGMSLKWSVNASGCCSMSIRKLKGNKGGNYFSVSVCVLIAISWMTNCHCSWNWHFAHTVSVQCVTGVCSSIRTEWHVTVTGRTRHTLTFILYNKLPQYPNHLHELTHRLRN